MEIGVEGDPNHLYQVGASVSLSFFCFHSLVSKEDLVVKNSLSFIRIDLLGHHCELEALEVILENGFPSTRILLCIG